MHRHFKEKSSDYFLKDLHKLKLLTNFDVNLKLWIKRLTHDFQLLVEMNSDCHQNLSGASVYEDL